MSVSVFVPIVVKSEANLREHWAKVARRKRDQKTEVVCALTNAVVNRKTYRHAEKIRVRFVRIGGRRMDDDNLHNALKAVRDAVAGWVNIDDGSERWVWDYAQEKLPRGGEKGIRIEMEAVQ